MSKIQVIQSQNCFHIDGTMQANTMLARELSPGVVHVLEVSLPQNLPGAIDLLDHRERFHADRFVFEKDRCMYVDTHAFTRMFLAALLGSRPESVLIARGDDNKPYVANSFQNVQFNISHTSGKALIAVTFGHSIGVDIEKHRPLNCLEVAEQFFTPREVAELRTTNQHEQLSAFFRCWTRKESLVKALGKGLFLPLDQFEVDIQKSEKTQLLLGSDQSLNWLNRFRIVDLPMQSGYSAAIAGSARPWVIATWHIKR